MELNNNREQLLRYFLTNDDFIRYSFEKLPELKKKFEQLFIQHPDLKKIAQEAQEVLYGKGTICKCPDTEKNKLKMSIFFSLGLNEK